MTQLEIMPAPPEHENKGLTWPNWPLKMRTSSSQAEGARREYAVLTQKFSGADGKVAKLHCVQVDDKFKPIAGTEFELDAQLVLLAMGFVHPVHEGLLKTLGVELDQRGNVRANTADYQTSRSKVFSAGDMRRGHRWSSGRSARGGSARDRSISFLMGIDGFAAVASLQTRKVVITRGKRVIQYSRDAGVSSRWPQRAGYPAIREGMTAQPQFCNRTPSITTVDAELASGTLESRMSWRSVPLIQRLRVIL